MSAPSQVRLAGGLVAFEDEARLEAAVRSLVEQELPPELRWTGIWLVVSPGKDRTLAIARRLAAELPIVRLIEEPERAGKSAALRQIARAADGDGVVLLNGDARAEPGAVAALWAQVGDAAQRRAVMGRPVPDVGPHGSLAAGLRVLWRLHHELHWEQITAGTGSHLSDELLYVPIEALRRLAPGVVNDGAFLGVDARAHGNELAYAPDAVVRVAAPRSWSEHVGQRRRIRRGHRQIADLLGTAPSTFDGELARHPGRAARTFLRAVRGEHAGALAVSLLVGADLLAAMLARGDDLVGRPAPAAWIRAGGAPAPTRVARRRSRPTEP